jgi:hypothetical protein
MRLAVRVGSEQDNAVGTKLLCDLTSEILDHGAWNQIAVLSAVTAHTR